MVRSWGSWSAMLLMLSSWGVVMKRLVMVALVVLVASERAEACGQCSDFTVVDNPFAFRREALPANASIFISGAVDVSSITVVGDVDGAVVDVPFAVSPAATADGSVYVAFDWTEAAGAVTITSNVGGATYSVGNARDVVAPAGLDVHVDEGGRADACCDNVAVTLTPTAAVDDDGATPQALVVRLSSAAGERVVQVPYSVGVGVTIGSSLEGCLQNDPLAVDGETVDALVSTLDWAGNASATTAVSFVYRAVRLGDGGSCGFETGPLDSHNCAQTGASAWASLAVLALLRRHQRR